MCIEDVHLTMGSRLLMIEFIFLLPLFALHSDYCMASEDISNSDRVRIEIVDEHYDDSGNDNITNQTEENETAQKDLAFEVPRVAVINSKGYQVLYKGQRVTIDSDNTVTVHIPKDRIDENNPPIRAFIP